MTDEIGVTVTSENLVDGSLIAIAFHENIDFVQLFPPELSLKLFSYVPDKELYSCSICSSVWRKNINNDTLWRTRCRLRDWTRNYPEPSKWNKILSHVSDSHSFKFRPSPVFPNWTQKANDNPLDIDPICEWGLHYRRCAHLQKNWNQGICIIKRMDFPTCFPFPRVMSDTSFNGDILAAFTTTGYVLLWSVKGVPELIKTIGPTASGNEMNLAGETIQLTNEFLVALYDNCEIRVFMLHTGSFDADEKEPYEFLYSLHIRGTETNEGFRLESIELSTPQAPDNTNDTEPENTTEYNIEEINGWIRDLIGNYWGMLNTDMEYPASEMLLLTSEDEIVVTGINCRNILVFDIRTRNLIQNFDLPLNSKCCSKGAFKSSKLFIPAKKVISRGSLEHREVVAFYLFVYSLREHSFSEEDYIQINASSQIDEIDPDESCERVVYASRQGAVIGYSFTIKDFLFMHHSTSCVDNLLVVRDYILYQIYHWFHARIFALNWSGEVLYDIDVHSGSVRGMQCVNDFIVSAGDAMELCIWDLKTGTKLYTLHHQPCRIQHLYADQTKIITMGKEDPPVLIGFW